MGGGVECRSVCVWMWDFFPPFLLSSSPGASMMLAPFQLIPVGN